MGALINAKEWKGQKQEGSVLVERMCTRREGVELNRNGCSVSIRGCGEVKADASQDGTLPGAVNYLGKYFNCSQYPARTNFPDSIPRSISLDL